MIEDILKQRGYKVMPDGKGICVIVPFGKNMDVAVDEVFSIARKTDNEGLKIVVLPRRA